MRKETTDLKWVSGIAEHQSLKVENLPCNYYTEPNIEVASGERPIPPTFVRQRPAGLVDLPALPGASVVQNDFNVGRSGVNRTPDALVPNEMTCHLPTDRTILLKYRGALSCDSWRTLLHTSLLLLKKHSNSYSLLPTGRRLCQ